MRLHSSRARSVLYGLASFGVCLALAGSAGAVIIDSGDGTGNTSAPADDPGWKYVGARWASGAVYLGNGWVVTANHVGPGDVNLDGVSYPYVPDSKIRIDDGMGNLADLIVFQIDPAPAWALLPINGEPDISGEPVIMIGRGKGRGASQTACHPTKNGYLWLLTSQTMRWGENLVDAYENVDDTDAFSTLFDQSGLTHEAQAALGDSGGGVFVKNGGQWELAGVMFATLEPGCVQPPDSAFHGNLTYASDLAAYREQIISIVRPECADEIDNDGDLLVDYPDDPDCTDEFDDQEKGPLVPSASPGGLAALAALLLTSGGLERRRRLR
ncbi:MAG: hypothetical protein JRG84_07835 [Deltaproteobacteria bacterium]|nr:hypothetical protein [Deltaproteobacteria bacterium]